MRRLACIEPRALTGGAGGLILGACLAVLVSACSTAPSGAPGVNVPPPPEGKLGKARKGGGYYLNDGPGDKDLSELAAIPNAVPRPEPLKNGANKPYTALGQEFVPMTEIQPYKARGIASWYGTRYHGNNTSSGEPYDMYAMTAAHPTLPIPSYAKVTNVANGRSVIVRINDRGPFAKGRLIDLSFTAAWKLDYADVGSTVVEVESIQPADYPLYANGIPSGIGVPASAARVTPVAAPVAEAAAVELAPLPALAALRAEGPAPTAEAPVGAPPAAVPASEPAASAGAAPGGAASTPAPLAAAAPGNYVQLGAFSSVANAEQARRRLGASRGDLSGRLLVLADGPWYRLQAGPYSDAGAAKRLAQELNGVLGLKPIVVKR